MTNFFSGKSETSRGSLFNLKKVFGHRSASMDVMNNFQHVADLVDVSF